MNPGKGKPRAAARRPESRMDDSFERARALFLAGTAAADAGRHAEAEAAFAESLAALPDRVSTLVNLGAARLRLNRPQPALDVLERAVELAPADADAWTHRGEALSALGRIGDAIASHDRALALDDGRGPDHFRRAIALNLLARHGEALAAMERACAANPAAAEGWYRRGQTLQLLGRHADAVPIYQEALRLEPSHALAWSNLGGIYREHGRHASASSAYRQALQHGGDDELNRYYLASVAEGEAPPEAPPCPYVESLFDGYAASFDQHLVQSLGYRGHTFVIAQLPPLLPRAARVLDLGCGTGLCAPLLAPLASRMVGVDLSSGMLERARGLGLYDALIHGELVAYLEATEERFDLVVAADVFTYVGALEPAFAGVRRVAVDGAPFAFCVEAADADERYFRLLPSLRYAHAERYVRELAARHGYRVEACSSGPLRNEQGQAITALYFVLRVGASPEP